MLKDIVSLKRREVMRQKNEFPLEELKKHLERAPAVQDFKKALQDDFRQVSIIAEYKKASPSTGLLRNTLEGSFEAAQTACLYQDAGAAAISVLTETNFFAGSTAHLKKIKNAVKLPVLRKDFIVDEYQVYESRFLGADAVLLIISLLTDTELKRFTELAHNLGMTAIVETGEENEILKAVECGSEIIAINNRDLKTMEVDINRTLKWGKLVPRDRILVSASGINCRSQIELLLNKAGVKSVLVGKCLTQSRNPYQKIKELLGKDAHCTC